ncbi:MAG: hypothetical protein K2L23_06275, partial [Odoribacter sp.]|nr:hypothetical protein [Odoribacter sp.]
MKNIRKFRSLPKNDYPPVPVIPVQGIKKIIVIIFLLTGSWSVYSQRSIEYKTSLSGMVATQKRLPLWATTHKHGIVPDSGGGLLQAGIFSPFNSRKKIQTAYGFSGVGCLTKNKNKIIIDELYFSLKWEKLRFDIGMKHPEEEYNGISAQNGNIVYSANTRALPGYNLSTDFISIPLTREVLAFRFNWADYSM